MEGKMVHFVGAGPGAPDLITVRGARLIGEADVIIYAGSLVNPALLEMKKESCRICDSAKMTLEEVIETIKEAEKEGLTTVRLHTGDPCVYGAVREQMDLLEEAGIRYDFAAHGATMVIFLSTGHLEELSRRLVDGGYAPDTPAAIVYKASWPDEEKYICTIETLAQTAQAHGITKTALIIAGETVAQSGYERSKLYDPSFTTEYRRAAD